MSSADKPSDSQKWRGRRKSTSTGSTDKWPVPSRPDEGATSEAQRARRASFWQSMAYLTSVGWLMALPIAAGVLLGRLLDDRLGSGYAWTLALFGVGLLLAAVE